MSINIDDLILNGYLRLYCAILGLPMIPKRCRVCGAELDKKYKHRHAGYLCKACFRKYNEKSP